MDEPPNPYSDTEVDDLIWEFIEEEIISHALGTSPFQQAIRLVQTHYFPNQPQQQSRRFSLKATNLNKRRRKQSKEGTKDAPSEESSNVQLGIKDCFNLGFIGGSDVAESIARGVIGCSLLPASRIRAARFSPRRIRVFEAIGVNVLEQDQVVEDCQVLMIGVSPNIVKDVLLQLRPKLSNKQLLVSVVPGTKLEDLQEWAGHNRFIRVMANTSAAVVGKATSVISLGEGATKEDGELIETVLGAIGKVWRADEKFFDAMHGLSHVGAASTYSAIVALAEGGIAAGLPHDLAMRVASQSVLGAASMAIESGKHPAQLKSEIEGPEGLTIGSIHELEKGEFRGTLMNAVAAAAKCAPDQAPL